MPPLKACIFCHIVDHPEASPVIYRDENVICFLPEKPVVFGHSIIASKQHFPDIYTIPDVVMEGVTRAAKHLATHYKKQIRASGINILHASGVYAQQSVMHFHIHLIPRFEGDGVNAWPDFPGITIDPEQMLAKLRLTR